MRRLTGLVRGYSWGDPTAIPELLGVEPTGEPQAEFWMGAHPSGPSLVGGIGLDTLIRDAPERLLGPEVAQRFGRLPMLFKVLAAARPLSIQAHPSLVEARAGFARENDAGVPLDAAERTYRDDNHKPELICALTEFEAKFGFREVSVTRRLLEELEAPGLDPLRSRLGADRPAGDRPITDAVLLADALDYLLRLPATEASALVGETTEAVRTTSSRAFGAELASSLRMERAFPGDIGVVVGLLMNHVRLEPGQALFLGPGKIHAYLSGFGVEVMANSDNVLRGGLTPKNVDIDELLAVLDCEPTEVPVQTPTSSLHTFEAPVADFALTRALLSDGVTTTVDGPAIVLVTSGWADLGGDRIGAGQPCFIGSGDGPVTLSGDGLAWVAGVGDL